MMAHRDHTVCWPLTLHLADEGGTRTSTFRYRTWEPFSVTLTLPLDEGAAEFEFARDLLADGVEEAVGEGRIEVSPHYIDPDLVTLRMFTAGRWHEFYARRDDVDGFIDATCELVPLCKAAERLDLDALVHQLLAGAR
ncbi:SsgA family sporulation/cell division regulator [Nonomuraea sp. CA-218870]|uniref:SsgA family sporulation/cell division regulator n=1 Tax=Nonomuraea sp. CA-218870 TaxID=3239998 RepID=UPI003D909B16